MTPTDQELLLACERVIHWYDGPETAQKQFDELRKLFETPSQSPRERQIAYLSGLTCRDRKDAEDALRALDKLGERAEPRMSARLEIASRFMAANIYKDDSGSIARHSLNCADALIRMHESEGT